MKIEKISDTQVRLTFTSADLVERNIKLEDILTSSDKVQELFHDIIEQAVEECGFAIDNSPLMVEALQGTPDSIMIIVTKLSSTETSETNPETLANIFAKSRELFKEKIKTSNNSKKDYTKSYFNKKEKIFIYSFESLDDVIGVCIRIYSHYIGESSLYKYNKRFFLVLEDEFMNERIYTEDIELLLSEYGKRHISSNLSKHYLIEHGEKIISNSAVNILTENFR